MKKILLIIFIGLLLPIFPVSAGQEKSDIVLASYQNQNKNSAYTERTVWEGGEAFEGKKSIYVTAVTGTPKWMNGRSIRVGDAPTLTFPIHTQANGPFNIKWLVEQ